jgi:hypothetical protein
MAPVRCVHSQVCPFDPPARVEPALDLEDVGDREAVEVSQIGVHQESHPGLPGLRVGEAEHGARISTPVLPFHPAMVQTLVLAEKGRP